MLSDSMDFGAFQSMSDAGAPTTGGGGSWGNCPILLSKNKPNSSLLLWFLLTFHYFAVGNLLLFLVLLGIQHNLISHFVLTRRTQPTEK